MKPVLLSLTILLAIPSGALAQMQTYEAASGHTASSAHFGYAGQAEDRMTRSGSISPKATIIQGAAAIFDSEESRPGRLDDTLYCGWPDAGCAFVVDAPGLGLIIVENPAFGVGISSGPKRAAAPYVRFTTRSIGRRDYSGTPLARQIANPTLYPT